MKRSSGDVSVGRGRVHRSIQGPEGPSSVGVGLRSNRPAAWSGFEGSDPLPVARPGYALARTCRWMRGSPSPGS